MGYLPVPGLCLPSLPTPLPPLQPGLVAPDRVSLEGHHCGVEGLDPEGVLGRRERLLAMRMETRLQQEEPPCAPPPQICKGEETRSGQAGFELVMSCEAAGKKLIAAILYVLCLALLKPLPSVPGSPSRELRHRCAVKRYHKMGIPSKF